MKQTKATSSFSFLTRLGCLFCLCLILLGLTPQAAFASEDKYYVPPQKMMAMIKVRDRGLSDLLTVFKQATASYSYDPEQKTINNLRFAIDANSIQMTLGGDISQFQMMLDMLRYPEVSFIQTDPAQVVDDGVTVVSGKLTARRITKDAKINVKINKVDESTGEMGLSINGTLKRDDYEMTENTGGKERFGKDLTILLEVQAIKQ